VVKRGGSQAGKPGTEQWELSRPPATAPRVMKEVDMPCKNETYKGEYGFTATGTITGLGAFAVVVL